MWPCIMAEVGLLQALSTSAGVSPETSCPFALPSAVCVRARASVVQWLIPATCHFSCLQANGALLGWTF